MRKKGFTLAEVLITMGIIGIIAAITMPTLMMDTKYKQLGVKLSKFYSSLYNVTKEYTASNNDFSSAEEVAAHLRNSFDIKSNHNGGLQLFTANTVLFSMNNSSADSAILSDNTQIAITSYSSSVFGALPDIYSNVRKYGSPIAVVWFDAAVNGLPSSSNTEFKFAVTTKGKVVPIDACGLAIFNNDWIVTNDFYTKGGVCNP